MMRDAPCVPVIGDHSRRCCTETKLLVAASALRHAARLVLFGFQHQADADLHRLVESGPATCR